MKGMTPQEQIKEARMAVKVADERLARILANIKVTLEDGWIKLDIGGDISASYPVFGDNFEEKIDSFAADLKKAVAGKRVSTLY